MLRRRPNKSAMAPLGISMRLMNNSRKAMRKPIWVKESPCCKKKRIMNGSKYRWFFKKPYREKRFIIYSFSSAGIVAARHNKIIQ